MDPAKIANAIGSSISQFGNYSAKAAAKANAVSAGAQNAAGSFNQASANNANTINAQTLAGQYSYNSAGANLANDFTMASWNQAAAWNEEMFARQMEFNAQEAQKQRDWAERMDNTKYQRAMADMKAGGLNPILAYGGINSSASGSAASVSAPQMGYAQGAQASGGLLGANDASISGYNGQMEYMGGMLGLLSAAIGGISSAMSAMGGMGKFGEELGTALGNIFNQKDNRLKAAYNYLNPTDEQKSSRNKTLGEYFNNRDLWNEKYDSNNAFNRYYNPTSNYYIKNYRRK